MPKPAAKEQTLMDEVEAALAKECPWSEERQHPTLYHYTDSVGFKGILESQKVRATHFEHLNDRNELLRGEQLVTEELEKIVSESSDGTALRILRPLLGEFRKEPPSTITDFYIASFSEESDLLSQWRAYASNASGYVIGFKTLIPPESINGPTDPIRPSAIIYRCDYSGESLKKYTQTLISKSIPIINEFICNHPAETLAIVVAGWKFLYLALTIEIPRYKDHAFHEENEWRIVAIPAPGRRYADTEFRATNKGLRPYFNVELFQTKGLLDIVEIVIGPDQDKNVAPKTTAAFLQRLGYTPKLTRDSHDAVLVRSSVAPYRG